MASSNSDWLSSGWVVAGVWVFVVLEGLFSIGIGWLVIHVALGPRDGMPHDCVVNCDLIFTVQKRRLQRRITKLTAAKLDEVHEAIRFALELP